MQAPAKGTRINSVTWSASSSSGTMTPGIETSLLSKARAGELDCAELSVLSVDQPTVTGAGVVAARGKAPQRLMPRMGANRFIILLLTAITGVCDDIAAHLDACASSVVTPL